MYIRKKYICDKISPLKKMMLPFEKKLPPKKRLTPNIIGKQFFEFLIFGFANIQLINKGRISRNIDI